MEQKQIPPESDHGDIQSPAQLEFDFKEAERLAKADAEREEEEALALKLWRDPNTHYGTLSNARITAQQQLHRKRWGKRQEEKREEGKQ